MHLVTPQTHVSLPQAEVFAAAASATRDAARAAQNEWYDTCSGAMNLALSSESEPSVGAARPEGALLLSVARNSRPLAERKVELGELLKRGLPYENVQLHDLFGASERASYQRLAEALESDPAARLGLHRLLMTGRLSFLSPHDQTMLLGQLERLLSQPLAPGIHRGNLLRDVVVELAQPACIDQKARNTCAAVAASSALAVQEPTEYARLVADLSSAHSPTATLLGGATLTRLEGTQLQDDARRTESQRLLIPAFMQLASGDVAYRNRSDDDGLVRDEMRELLGQLFNRPVTTYDIGVVLRDDGRLRFAAASSEAQQAAAGFIRSTLDLRQTLLASVFYVEGPHMLQLSTVSRHEGGDSVVYQNPHGALESMPMETFTSLLRTLHHIA